MKGSNQATTIAAIATPPGEGAISIVRLSGPMACQIGEAIFSGPVSSYISHTAHYGDIVDRAAKTIDSVLLLVMRAPRSYTGEDIVEIFCHGSNLIAQRVLERTLEAGAQPAQPGEFSLRAFLHGKLDLAQAEAVQGLIAAKSLEALHAAKQQLDGRLSQTIRSFQHQLTNLAAILEAGIDFPEEDLEFTSIETLAEQLEETLLAMQKLHATFHQGQRISEGISLCLAGTPNVGKSSLLNALLGKERAIVHTRAGTTRDLLHEELRLGGLLFRITDTAGIRNTQEEVELEGIRRSEIARREADFILLLLDASRPLSEEDRSLIQTVSRENSILVWNKIDLARPIEQIDWPTQVEISAQTGHGLDQLPTALERKIWHKGPPSQEELYITQERHAHALHQAILAGQRALNNLHQRNSLEFAAYDLRELLQALGTILGTNVTEEILTAIFSKFCLGK